MSIPAQTNTTDYQVYLRKYLDGLNLQSELNNKNFNANYQFQKNGIQEQTEPADTRSIEERMADIEKLKVQARAMLNKVTDITNTNEVMSYLVQNSKIMFFFIQNFISIEEVLKKQYSMGILAPQMISLIYSKYLKYNEEVLIPDSQDFDLVSSLMTKEDAEEIKNGMRGLKVNGRIEDYGLPDVMKDLIPSIPSRKDISLYTNNPEKYVKEIKGFANKYRDGLTIDDVNPVIDAINDPAVFNNGEAMSNILTPFGQKIQIYLGNAPTYNPMFEIELPQKSSKVRKQRIKKVAVAAAAAEAEAAAEAQAAEAQAAAATPATDPPEAVQLGSGLLNNREKHIHRYKVLKGEVIAGNTSPAIVKELRSLVVKMVKLSELDKSQAMMILKELK